MVFTLWPEVWSFGSLFRHRTLQERRYWMIFGMPAIHESKRYESVYASKTLCYACLIDSRYRLVSFRFSAKRWTDDDVKRNGSMQVTARVNLKHFPQVETQVLLMLVAATTFSFLTVAHIISKVLTNKFLYSPPDDSIKSSESYWTTEGLKSLLQVAKTMQYGGQTMKGQAILTKQTLTV